MLISLFMFVLIHNVFLFQKEPPSLPRPPHPWLHLHLLHQHDPGRGLLWPSWRPPTFCSGHGHSNTTNNCFRSQLAFSENPFILTHMQAILSNHPLNHHQNVFIKMFIINVNKKSSGEILSRHNPPPPLTSRHIHQVQKHKSDPKNFCPIVSNMKNWSCLILEYCIYLLSLTRRVSSNLNKQKMVLDRSTLAPQLSWSSSCCGQSFHEGRHRAGG